MLPLETIAPDFELMDTVTDRLIALEDVKSEIATVVMFICNHCPYVKHVEEGLVALANDYIPEGISIVAISSNDIEKYPEDAPDKMKHVATHNHYPFPYLFDKTQQVAKNYHAACTPDFFIFNKELELVYRGQMDDSRPGNDVPVTGKDLRAALNDIMNGNPVNENQKPSIGCNIKWH